MKELYKDSTSSKKISHVQFGVRISFFFLLSILHQVLDSIVRVAINGNVRGERIETAHRHICRLILVTIPTILS